MPERRTRDAANHPLERATDQGGLKAAFHAFNAKLADYRAIVFIIFGVLAWLGWTQKSPSARIAGVEHDVEAVRDTIRVVKDSVAAIRAGQITTHNALEVLVRLRCFDSTLSARDMQLAGLDCTDIEAARRRDRARR